MLYMYPEWMRALCALLVSSRVPLQLVLVRVPQTARGFQLALQGLVACAHPWARDVYMNSAISPRYATCTEPRVGAYHAAKCTGTIRLRIASVPNTRLAFVQDRFMHSSTRINR
jgi:hypothetical protein